MPETLINGVDTQGLVDTIKLVKQRPELGRFEFRAKNQWINGGKNQTTLSRFFGAGEEWGEERLFRLDADEPEILLSEDSAPNPVEHLLNALAACVTTSMVYHAAARGIRIEELESELKGTIDLRGFLGLSPDIRPGYQSIAVTFRVKSDAPAEQLRELCNFSPVFAVVTHGTKVNIEIEKKGEPTRRMPSERREQPGSIDQHA